MVRTGAQGHLSDTGLLCRYMKVKYDDLVSKYIDVRGKVTQSLFEFVGIPFTSEVAKNVANFRLGYKSIEDSTEKGKERLPRGYFGVYRPDNYNPDHWRDQMEREVKNQN